MWKKFAFKWLTDKVLISVSSSISAFISEYPFISAFIRITFSLTPSNHMNFIIKMSHIFLMSFWKMFQNGFFVSKKIFFPLAPCALKLNSPFHWDGHTMKNISKTNVKNAPTFRVLEGMFLSWFLMIAFSEIVAAKNGHFVQICQIHWAKMISFSPEHTSSIDQFFLHLTD